MYEEEDEEVVRDALKHLNAEQQEWRLELAAPEVRRRGRPCEGLTQEETECLVRCEAGDGMGQGFFVCVFRREEREVMGEEERKAKERAFEEESEGGEGEGESEGDEGEGESEGGEGEGESEGGEGEGCEGEGESEGGEGEGCEGEEGNEGNESEEGENKSEGQGEEHKDDRLRRQDQTQARKAHSPGHKLFSSLFHQTGNEFNDCSTFSREQYESKGQKYSAWRRRKSAILRSIS